MDNPDDRAFLLSLEGHQAIVDFYVDDIISHLGSP